MSEKSAFSVATGFQGGVTVGIHADSWDEFRSLCVEAFGDGGVDVATGLYAHLQAAAFAGEKQLAAATSGALGAQQQPAFTATVPSVTYTQQPVQQFQQAPAGHGQAYQPVAAGGPPPGQTCDPKDPTKTKWISPGVSKKTGKPYNGFFTHP